MSYDDEPRCGYCETPLPRGVFEYGTCDCDGAEAARLRALVARAPHAAHCEAGAPLFPGPCNCWKAEA